MSLNCCLLIKSWVENKLFKDVVQMLYFYISIVVPRVMRCGVLGSTGVRPSARLYCVRQPVRLSFCPFVRPLVRRPSFF